MTAAQEVFIDYTLDCCTSPRVKKTGLTATLDRMDNFAVNCTNFSRDDILRAAVARGVTAGVCTLLSALILFIVVFVRAFELFLERLFVYLTAITVWALAVGTMLVRPYTGLSQFCAVSGFLGQWSASCVPIFAFVVSLVILCKVCGMCNVNLQTDGTKKLLVCGEAALVLFPIVLPLPFIWVPFLTGNYGADVEPWCWIEIHNKNCSENVAGFWEQIGLFYAPFGALGLLIVLFVLITFGVFCKQCLARTDLPLQKRQALGFKAAEAVILLVFLLLFGIFAGLEASSSLYFGFTKKQQGYPLLLLHAIITPVYKLLLPVGFMFQLRSLKKFKQEKVKAAIEKWKQLFAFCCKKFRGNQPMLYAMTDRSHTYVTAKNHVSDDSYSIIPDNPAINDPSSSSHAIYATAKTHVSDDSSFIPDNPSINDPSSSSHAIYTTPDCTLTGHDPPAKGYGSCNLPARASIKTRKGHYCLVC